MFSEGATATKFSGSRSGGGTEHAQQKSAEKKKQKQLTSNQHNADGEDFLGVGVGGNVSKPDTRQTTQRKIQSCDIFGLQVRTTGVVALIVRLIYLRR